MWIKEPEDEEPVHSVAREQTGQATSRWSWTCKLSELSFHISCHLKIFASLLPLLVSRQL